MAEGKWLISTDGGGEPVWARDGSELFYRSFDSDRSLVAVEILPGPAFTAGRQERLFSTSQFEAAGSHQQYDVTGDGERFIFVAVVDAGTEAPQVIVVEHFFEELQERVGR